MTSDKTPKLPPQPKVLALVFPLMSMAFSWPAPSCHSGVQLKHHLLLEAFPRPPVKSYPITLFPLGHQQEPLRVGVYIYLLFISLPHTISPL